MRIAYLLDRPELGGGVKVVFEHAALLARRGHRVTVAGRGPRPAWAGCPEVAYFDYGEAPALPAPVDLAFATYWTTLAAVAALPAAATAHFCQGYEADWPHERDRRAAIEAAYAAAALPTLAVTPALAARLAERHGRRCRVVPPPADPRFRPTLLGRLRRRPRRPPWIAVPGIFEAEVKGVPTALAAVRHLEAAGRPCRVLRVSVLPPSDAERALRPAERFLTAVPPAEVAAALAGCDLLLMASRPGEGFGLPLLEAMAAGVPAVASRLPSTEWMAALGERVGEPSSALVWVSEEGAGIAAGEEIGTRAETAALGPVEASTAYAAALVPAQDPAAFATAAEALLADPRRWRRARRLGREAARRFAPQTVAGVLEEAVHWAVAAGGTGAGGATGEPRAAGAGEAARAGEATRAEQATGTGGATGPGVAAEAGETAGAGGSGGAGGATGAGGAAGGSGMRAAACG